MFFVSEIDTKAPEQFHTGLQEKVYQTLQELQIPFARVDTDEAITMEDCVQINAKLDMKMVKTLFLCNRQQTAFYLFITSGDKPFRAKDFSAALDIARVSFAPAELMEQSWGRKSERQPYSAPCWTQKTLYKSSLTGMFYQKNGMGAATAQPPAT